MFGRKKSKTKARYADGRKHQKKRSNCKWCKKKKHNVTKSGNTCRFHKHGLRANVFCKTHHSMRNPAVRRYCVRTRRK